MHSPALPISTSHTLLSASPSSTEGCRCSCSTTGENPLRQRSGKARLQYTLLLATLLLLQPCLAPIHTHTTRAQLAVITDGKNKRRWLSRLPVRNSNGPARATPPNGPARARNRPSPQGCRLRGNPFPLLGLCSDR